MDIKMYHMVVACSMFDQNFLDEIMEGIASNPSGDAEKHICNQCRVVVCASGWEKEAEA